MPDIHLSAPRAVSADTGILVVVRLFPPDSSLAVDELKVARALGIAVSYAVLSSGFVIRVLGQAATFVHEDEVEGSIETAATRDKL